MNVNLYVMLLAGISLVFFLLYPADSTFGASAITSMMRGEMTLSDVLTAIANQGASTWGILIGVGIFAGAIATIFGASAVLPIVWNVMIFFVIPNLFILPTHILIEGTAGMPTEISVTIIFIMNVLLLLTAIEFWR